MTYRSAAVSIISAGLLLAACGGEDGADTRSPAADASPTTSAATGPGNPDESVDESGDMAMFTLGESVFEWGSDDLFNCTEFDGDFGINSSPGAAVALTLSFDAASGETRVTILDGDDEWAAGSHIPETGFTDVTVEGTTVSGTATFVLEAADRPMASGPFMFSCD